MLTLANLLTMLRLVLVPVFAMVFLYSHPVAALFCFVAAAVTDLIDGSIARWLHQQSHFGAVLDPVADKFLLDTVFIFLVRESVIPLWFGGLVVGRDVLIMLTIIVMRMTAIPVEYNPTRVSKTATLLQIAAAGYGLVVFCGSQGYLRPIAPFIMAPVLEGLVWMAGGLTAVTVGQYLKRGLKMLGTN